MNSITKSILTITLFGLTFTGYGQSKIAGKIIESENNTVLGAVEIINLETQISVTSNLDGSFEIINEGLYSFKKEGYMVKNLNLIFNQYYIILLNINPLELNEIIVSNSFN